MPSIRQTTTLANRTGVIFAMNTPMREIRYLQTRILTGIQTIDQFILNYNIFNRPSNNLQILRLQNKADEIRQHISDGIDLCTSGTILQYYKPVFDDYHTTLAPMAFVLDSYANDITTKDKNQLLNTLDGIPPPPPYPRPSIHLIPNDDTDDESDMLLSSSDDDSATSDDESTSDDE
jgi:hypothetical protein